MEDYCVELAAKLGSSFTQDPQICRSYNHDLGEMPAVLLGLAAGAQNFWVFCKERLDRSKKEKNHRVGFNSHQ